MRFLLRMEEEFLIALPRRLCGSDAHAFLSAPPGFVIDDQAIRKVPSRAPALDRSFV